MNSSYQRIENNAALVPNFKKADFDSLRLHVSQVDWTSKFDGKNAFQMWESFKCQLSDAQRLFVPLRQIRKNKKQKPVWYNMGIKTIISEKKKVFHRYKISPSAANCEAYKQSRGRVKATIRSAKRTAEINLALENDGDLKKFFSFYKFKRKHDSIGPFKVGNDTFSQDGIRLRY